MSWWNRSLYVGRDFPLMLPDGEQGGGDGGNSKTDDNANRGGDKGGQSNDGEFTEAQQRQIGKLIAEERRKEREKAKLDFEQERKDAEAEAERAAQAERDKAAGDFAKVEDKLKSDIATLEAERDELKSANDRLTEAITAGLEPVKKDVPAKVLAMFPGEEADVLGLWEFIHRPATQELITDLAEPKQPIHRGNGLGPTPRGDGKPSAQTEARALAERVPPGLTF